jgi:hypothetical protein
LQLFIGSRRAVDETQQVADLGWFLEVTPGHDIRD